MWQGIEMLKLKNWFCMTTFLMCLVFLMMSCTKESLELNDTFRMAIKAEPPTLDGSLAKV